MQRLAHGVHDRFDRRGDVGRNGALVRAGRLQRRELAVEEGGRHEVAAPFTDPRLEQLAARP